MIDLRYVMHGAAIALVWFAVVNVGMAAGVAIVGRGRGRRDGPGSARFWLALRLLPAAASTAFVGVLFVPSYWTYEPRVVEDFDVTLTLLALAALTVVGAAACRGCAAWVRGRCRWVRPSKQERRAAITYSTQSCWRRRSDLFRAQS